MKETDGKKGSNVSRRQTATLQTCLYVSSIVVSSVLFRVQLKSRVWDIALDHTVLGVRQWRRMESDSVYTKMHNLDLIDEEWAADSLSDDDIDISPEMDLPMDDTDLETQDPLSNKEDEKWLDLSLDTFIGENAAN